MRDRGAWRAMTDRDRWRVPLSDVASRRGAPRGRARGARLGLVEHGPASRRARGRSSRRSPARRTRSPSRTGRRRSISPSSRSAAGQATRWCSRRSTSSLPRTVVCTSVRRPSSATSSGPDDLNLDPTISRPRSGRGRRRSIVLHYAGFACDLDGRRSRSPSGAASPSIEDAAHAPGATLERAAAAGRSARSGCFSFFSNKNLPVGEGGMVVTDDDESPTGSASLRSHGMTTLTWQRHRGHASSYDVVDAGLQLPPRRAARGARRRSARPARRTRTPPAGAARAPVPRAARRRGRAVVPVRRRRRTSDSSTSSRRRAAPAGGDRGTTFARSCSRERIQTSVHYPPIHGFTYYAELGDAARCPHRRHRAAHPHASALPAHDRRAGGARRNVARRPPRYAVIGPHSGGVIVGAGVALLGWSVLRRRERRRSRIS